MCRLDSSHILLNEKVSENSEGVLQQFALCVHSWCPGVPVSNQLSTTTRCYHSLPSAPDDDDSTGRRLMYYSRIKLLFSSGERKWGGGGGNEELFPGKTNKADSCLILFCPCWRLCQCVSVRLCVCSIRKKQLLGNSCLASIARRKRALFPTPWYGGWRHVVEVVGIIRFIQIDSWIGDQYRESCFDMISRTELWVWLLI